MKRREFLITLAAGLSAAGLFPRQLLAVGSPDRKPNVILVLVDDMGWRDTGFAGNTFIETPHLDALAGSGIVFTQAYAAAPNCAPTRACLMTGQYTPRHGVFTVDDENHVPGLPHQRILAAKSNAELATESHTIAEALQSAGYTTGMVGMWNLGRGRRGPCTPTGQGFDSFLEPKRLGFERDAYQNATGNYLTDVMTDAGIDFILKNKARPFFLYLAYHAVHGPFDPKADLLAKYQKKTPHRGNLAAHAATVEALDQNIGRLRAELVKLGLDKATYILLTSDNGGTEEYIAPLRGGKGTLYEGGLRVPACIAGPGIAPKQTTAEPISSIDVYPTLLEIAGAAPKQGHPIDGMSLLPLMEGKAKALDRKRLFWHFPCYIGKGKPSSVMREGNLKLIEFFEDSRVELYDLVADPGERRDLAKSRPDLAARLHLQLKRLQSELKAPRPTQANPNYDPAATRPRGRKPQGRNHRTEERQGARS